MLLCGVRCEISWWRDLNGFVDLIQSRGWWWGCLKLECVCKSQTHINTLTPTLTLTQTHTPHHTHKHTPTQPTAHTHTHTHTQRLVHRRCGSQSSHRGDHNY